MSHIGAWQKQSLSLFSHFNFVFSLPFLMLHGIFRLQNYSLCLCLCLFLFCFSASSVWFLCLFFLLLCPSFIHVALTELMFVQVVLVERTLVWAMFGPCLGHVSNSQLLAVDACFVLDWCRLSHILWFPIRRFFGEGHFWYREQEVLFVPCVCHLFWKNDSYVTVSFSGCHWQCGERTLTRSGSEAWPGPRGANSSFSNMEND